MTRFEDHQSELTARPPVCSSARDDGARQLRLITDKLPVLISYVGSDLRYRFINREYERWFGMDAAQIEGRHLREVLGSDAFDGLAPYIQRVLAGETVTFESLVPYQGAGERYVRVHYAADTEDSGRIRGFVAMVEDLSQFQGSKRQEARLAAIVADSADAIIGKDLDGNITDWNRGAERIYGYTAEEAVGRNISMTLPPDRMEEERQILDAIRMGRQIADLQVLRRHKDGRLIHLALTVSPLRDIAGRVVGASTIARDVTARLNMENRLRRVNTALVQRRVEMQDFLSIIAHDLKHPVVGIRGLLSLVLQGNRTFDDVSRENIELCVAECDRMHSLLDRLTELARIQRMHIRCKTVRLRAFLQQQADVFRAQLTQMQAHIEVRCDDVQVDIAADLVAQALVNLIDNALKYGCPRPGCTIHVDGRCGEEDVEIAVADEGAGVSTRLRDAIFKPFRRGVSGQNAPAGSGIGLAAVRSLLRRIHGDVHLDPDTTRGARFVLRIPREVENDAGEMEDHDDECDER